jgi:outer membrane protein assembly factor BamB
VRNGNRLYVSTMAGEVVQIDPSNGRVKWRVQTDGPVFSSVEVGPGYIFFGSADHNVYAVNAGTGKIMWKTPTDGAVLAGPAFAKGVVCIGSADTKIYGLRATDGKKLWTVQGKNLFQSKAATDGTHFFVGGWDNYFRCIDAESGNEVWAIKLGKPQLNNNFSALAPAITSPAVGDGKVYVSTNDGILHALNISNGKEAWRIDKQKMGYSSPLFHNGKVYCTLSDDGKVFRVDAATGHVDWEAETNAVFYDSSCAFGGGKIFIGAVGTASPDHKSHRALLNGILFAIDDKSGKVEWKYRLPTGHLLASPAADNERVYASSMSGIVSAFPITSQQPSSVTLAEPRRP